MSDVGVLFRRIRGRIVPIFKRGASVAKKSVPVVKKAGDVVGKHSISVLAGTLLGSDLGIRVGTRLSRPFKIKNARVLDANMGKGTIVDAKKEGEKAVKGLTVITSRKDIDAAFGWASKADRDFAKSTLHRELTSAEGNPFATRLAGKDYVFTAPKTNKFVLGHEIGHIIDYRKNGLPGYYQTGFSGTLIGSTLRREKRAWNYSPWKQRKKDAGYAEEKLLKSAALGTYSAHTRGVQLGALGGTVLGTGLIIAARR